MSEADGVDSGAICKRGFIHLQFAEKPEAPEAERHLGLNFGFRRLSRKHDRSCSSGDRSFRCWIVELCVSRFPNAETHGAAILAFGGLNSSGVEVAPLLCFLDSSTSSKKSSHLSVGWVPWDGPLGVGFCAGLLPSVPNNRAGFSYSGFARVQQSLRHPRTIEGLRFLHATPRGGIWVRSTCDTLETSRLQVFPSEWLRSSRFFQDLLYRIPTKFRISVGWVPWDGPLGVGFCAGLLPSVPNNRAGFSYSGFAR
ncbi:hypothetical protein V1477_017523, partial [Vespula maculifrons]